MTANDYYKPMTSQWMQMTRRESQNQTTQSAVETVATTCNINHRTTHPHRSITKSGSRYQPNDTKPSQAKPSQAKPSQAKPSQAKPSQAKPNQTARLVLLSYLSYYLI